MTNPATARRRANPSACASDAAQLLRYSMILAAAAAEQVRRSRQLLEQAQARTALAVPGWGNVAGGALLR
jgi:hypothetical protein